MCFSATSSFVVAAGLTFTGILALKNAPQKRFVPLAALPIGFAVQQAAEGIVWLTLNQPETRIHIWAVRIFLGFAFIVWPLWIPWAVKVYVQNNTKKMLLTLCQLIGLLFAIAALFFLWVDTTTVSNDTGNLVYRFQHSFFTQVSGLSWYVLPTIFPFLIACNRFLGTVFGSLVISSLIVTYKYMPKGLISVWCFLAAVISVTVLGLIWEEKRTLS